MTNTRLQNNQVNPESELTIGDLIKFIFKAKWFALVGIIFGAAIALSYLAIIPSVYESKITIQIKPSTYVNQINNSFISSEEILERLKFSQTYFQVIKVMNLSPKDESLFSVDESLKSAVTSKDGTFLTLTAKAGSVTSSEELVQNIANVTIVIISQLNAPRINHLKNVFKSNQQLIAIAHKNPRIDIASLITTNLTIEALLSSAEISSPTIVDGPISSSQPIAPKTKPILLLGALIGLGLGLLLFYIKDKFSKK